jgi:capsule polysaccharide export protein KpsC/LpsZ
MNMSIDMSNANPSRELPEPLVESIVALAYVLYDQSIKPEGGAYHKIGPAIELVVDEIMAEVERKSRKRGWFAKFIK